MLHKLKKRIKNQRGMTLVELLAVIVILGIISAIAVPSIGGIINKTKKDAKVAEAVQIINAAKLYNSTNPTDHSMNNDDLETYLDNVKDTKLDYIVTATPGTNGKLSYSISGHDAGTIADKDGDGNLTEAELLEYSGGN
ncbi:type II secretion system protein [Neobacillus sp. PS3-40]|uniref:type IV pilin protein n=1 Tax=Neobacillus sp. PS3-40 TaxID=3070679 RepID=UPI0027DF2D78|nr:type II secretion system protein [Neobacillus sp. PS3-40]WML45553.1 type II secretion system protein [Neobacillus sp. PS3-40]